MVKFKFFLDCSDFCADDLFVELVPILRSSLDGHNVCIFAYGKTRTRKNYTMVLLLVVFWSNLKPIILLSFIIQSLIPD